MTSSPSSSLPPHSGHNPFRVPEGYFDTFANRMMARIAQLEAPTPVLHRLRWLPWIGAACVAALTLVLSHAGLNDSGTALHGASAYEERAAAAYEEQMYDYFMTENPQLLAEYETDY